VKKKVKKKKEPPKKTLPQTNLQPEVPNTFDFGGLPQRDLKKNLGCG
jgi:hypothetical protein